MKLTYGTLVCIGTSSLLAVLAVPALGSDGTGEGVSNTPGLPEQLEEVVITAQKRREVLQDIPVAASVVDSTNLAKSNATDISDLSRLVPSVDIPSSLSGRVAYGMRGISSSTDQPGFVSGVSIMVDGVSVPSDSQGANDLEDIERVEVLKGPQQTLGGRGAAVGLINIVTRSPADHLTAAFSATTTTDHERRFNAFVGGPLGGSLQGSLSAYDHQTYFPITNIATGDKSNVSADGVRGKLLFKPTDNLSVQLTGNYQESTLRGSNTVYSYVYPGAYILLGLNPPPLPPPVLSTLSRATLLAGVTPGFSNQRYSSPQSAVGTRDRYYSTKLDIDYELGSVSLGSTTSYQHDRSDAINELFDVATFFANDFRDAFAKYIGPFGPGAWDSFDNEQLQNQTISQFSQEFKVVSTGDGPFSYVAGLYFENQKVDSFLYRTLTPAPIDNDVVPETRTYDVYGRGTWKLAPNTSLLTGVRFNSDHLSYRFDGIEGTNGIGQATPISSSNSESTSAVIGDLSLQQQAGGTMLYATYARGYNPAQFNLGYFTGTTPPVDALPVTGQEHVNHFEIGSKGTYFDQRMRLNLSIFDTIYQNYQVQTAVQIPGVLAPQLFLAAAAKAETRGAELDTQWLPSHGLRLDLNLAYSDAKFEDYGNAPCWSAVVQTPAMGCEFNSGRYTQDLSGKPLPNAPKFKGMLSVEQRVPLGTSSYELVVGGNYAYRTRAEMLPDQNPEGIQGGFGLLNLNLGISELSGKYSVTAFVVNATDHHYASRVEDFFASVWQSNAVNVQPARDANRYAGLRIDASL